MKKCDADYGYFIVFFSLIIMIAQWSIIYSFGVFLKPLLLEFNWSRASVSAAFSFSSFFGGISTIIMGVMNDRIGSRAVMSLCGFLLGTGCILVSQTGQLWHFYASFGIVIGIAMGGQFTPLMSTVARWFNTRRGIMSGIVASGVGVGALIGPQVSNYIVIHYGWRKAYLTLGIVAVFIIVSSAQFLKQGADEGSRTDALRQKGAMDLGRNIRSSQFWLFMFTAFCYGYVLFSTMIHIVAHAIDKGLTPKSAVGILSLFGILSVIGKITFGRILDRIGSKHTMAIGFVMSAVAFICLIIAEQGWSIFLGAGLFGLFYGACTVSHSPMTAMLFGLKSHGLILGLCGTSVTLGGAMGPYLTGYIFDRTGSYRSAFIVCAVVCLSGVVATAYIEKRKQQIIL